VIPRGLSRVRRAALAVLATLVVAWGIAVAAVVVTGRFDTRRPADAIVVLGAAQYSGKPSPVLQARLDHALELWRARLAPRLVLTGGVGTRDTVSEAEVGRRYLVARGVPDSAILLERAGRTSGQSIRAAAALLELHGLTSVILVSDPFHTLRLRILAARHGLSAVSSPTRTSPIARNAGRYWRYVLGEAVRLPVAVVFPSQ
jgi:uncharacterized SAM-binding protein YcdF (DUF218 family)